MTQQLDKYIEERPKDADLSIFHLPSILDETTRKFYAIVTKDSALKPTLNCDVQHKICQLFVTGFVFR